MQDRLYPLFYRTLAPSRYHVYLHPDDYGEVEGVMALIVADAQKALDARVARLNRQSRWLLSNATPVEVPAGGWEIHIHPEANGELGRGEIGIVSQLSIPAAPQFEGGTPTSRIVRTVITSAGRRSATAPEAGPAEANGPTPAPAAASAGVLTDAKVMSATDRPPSLPAGDGMNVFARLAYVDEQGPHEYAMKKDVVSIGRGGREHWVDVQLITTSRVSREHCRIRRDDQGRFYLHDVSTWGTTVNGDPVRPIARVDGAAAPDAREQELPRQARIALADAVVIEFVAH
jgi:hypothetical protein